MIIHDSSDTEFSNDKPEAEAIDSNLHTVNKISYLYRECSAEIYRHCLRVLKNPVDAEDEYAIDCHAIKSRLRIGYANILDPKLISEEGTTQFELMHANNQKDGMRCIDLYVNHDIDEYGEYIGPHAFYTTVVGFSHGIMNISSTSAIAPFGLAYAIFHAEDFKKKHGYYPSPVQLKKIILKGHEKLIVDPLQYGQFVFPFQTYLREAKNKISINTPI